MMSEEIIKAVAEYEGVSISEIPAPLYEYIDADALEKLISSMEMGAVSFQYDSYTVNVRDDGIIDIG